MSEFDRFETFAVRAFVSLGLLIVASLAAMFWVAVFRAAL